MDQQTAFEAVTKMMAGCAEFFWDSFVALQVNGITGDYAEFGCHTGGSFQAAYHAIAKITPERHMWAFDSWAALPDDHPRDAHPGWRAPGVPDAGGVDNFHAANERHGVAPLAVHDGRGLLQGHAPDARCRRRAHRHRARVRRLRPLLEHGLGARLPLDRGSSRG